MEIKILGPGCRNCVTLERHTRTALERLGAEANITKVEDYADIASYGVMKTPGLVVNGKVIISGRVPKPNDIAEHLRPLITQ